MATREEREERRRAKRAAAPEAQLKLASAPANPLDQWREQGRKPPALAQERGGGGVMGEKWSKVYLTIDNARLERDKTYADGQLPFYLTTQHTTGDGAITVPWALAAVRRIKIDPFTWPTLPTPPAMKTNSAQLSVLIAELAGRAAATGGTTASHFRGELTAFETASYLHYQSAPIADALARSVGARVRWYRNSVEFSPPVTLDQLTLVVSKGDRPVAWLPHKLTVMLNFGGANIVLSLASGKPHNLEVGMKIYFETTPTDGAGTAVVEMAADTAVAVLTVPDPTTVQMNVATGAYNGASGPFNVLVPARRVQINLEVEAARVEE